MDWASLITPAIIAGIPLLMAFVKRGVPDKAKVAIPVVAVAFGPVFEAAASMLQGQAASPGKGLLMGASAVALREIVDQAKKMGTSAAPIILLPFLLMLAVPAHAQAVCDTSTAPTTSTCGPDNSLSWIVPITNGDGTALNDLSTFRVVFGPNAALCSAQGVPTVGSTVRNMGNLQIPPTPLPNTRATTKLGPLILPNGQVFSTVQVANVVGTVSPCATGVQFTFQGKIPAAPTGVLVGN